MKTLFRTLAAAALFSFPAILAAQKTLNVPTTAYPTIGSALQAASNGDTILVAAGTYAEQNTISGLSVTITGATGAVATGALPGGFDNGPAFTIKGAAASQTVIQGFTISGSGKQQSAGGPKGGIYISGASPTIQSNTFSGNYCAGIAVLNGNPQIINNTITGTTNTACTAEEGLGSGIILSGSDPNTSAPVANIQGNTIYGNTASVAYSGDKGGGAAINITGQTTVYVTSNTLRNNTSTGYGGALYVANTPSLYFENNLVYGNQGISGGLDIVVPGSTVGPVAGALINNTIAYNTATTSNAGSDVYISGNLAQYQIVNNIVAGNTASQSAFNCGTTYAGQILTPLVFDHNDIYYVSGSTASAVGGACTNPKGTFGNIAVAAQFVSPGTSSTANFQLQTTSPAIDAGNNSSTLVTSTDLAGNPRYTAITSSVGPVIDMGAYEYQPPLACKNSCIAPSHLQIAPDSWTPKTGGAVNLTATFFSIADNSSVAGPPSGDVGPITFYEDGNPVGTANSSASSNPASATLQVNGLTAGLHTFYATWPGSTNYSPATTVYINVLVKAPTLQNTTTTLVAQPNPTTVGTTVTLTATVAAANGGAIPPGTVYFLDGGSIINGSGTPLNTSTGTAAYSSTFASGTHSLLAAFVPTDTLSYNGSTGSTTLVVTGAAVNAVLTVSPTSNISYGDTVTVTVKLTSATSGITAVPTGNLAIIIDGAVAASPVPIDATGTGTYVSNSLPAGNHTYTCTYSGDAVYAPQPCNTLSLTIAPVIAQAKITASVATAQAYAPFTVYVAAADPHGNPLGNASVTLHQDGITPDKVSSTGATGIATFANVTGTVAAANFSAVVASTTNYAASPAATLTVPIAPDQTSGTLIAAPTTAYQGDTISFVATVLNTQATATPAGSVTLTDENNNILGTQQFPATTLTSALASLTFSISTLTPGTRTITATYNPGVNFLAAPITPVTVTILNSSFTLTTDPSITIQTEHHKSLNVDLTSIGSFSGDVSLSCATPLPPVLSCTFGKPIVTLTAGGTVTTTLSLETDAVPNFYAFLPLVLLPLAATRKRFRKLALLGALTLAAILPLNGCSGHYPDHTPPGTYDIVVNATGTAPGSSHSSTQTAHITLIVTP